MAVSILKCPYCSDSIRKSGAGIVGIALNFAHACTYLVYLSLLRLLYGWRHTCCHIHAMSPPWPSGLKRWNQTLVPVVRARFEPRCGRPHFAPTHSGVRVCGRNRTETREREWAEGTVSSLPGTLNVRIKFCHSTGIARSGGGVRASTTSYA